MVSLRIVTSLLIFINFTWSIWKLTLYPSIILLQMFYKFWSENILDLWWENYFDGKQLLRAKPFIDRISISTRSVKTYIHKIWYLHLCSVVKNYRLSKNFVAFKYWALQNQGQNTKKPKLHKIIFQQTNL